MAKAKKKSENNDSFSNQSTTNNAAKTTMEDVKYLLSSTYYDCIDYCLKKYGKVPENYFYNNINWNKNEKNSRTQEGLIIHHIDEDKAILLSHKYYAQKNPWEYQLSHRLVYCNLIEHLILHIKITEYPHKDKNDMEIVGLGGVFIMIYQFNDMFSGIVYKRKWWNDIKNSISHLKAEYLECVKYFMKLNKGEYPLSRYMASWDLRFRTANFRTCDKNKWNEIRLDIQNLYYSIHPIENNNNKNEMNNNEMNNNKVNNKVSKKNKDKNNIWFILILFSSTTIFLFIVLIIMFFFIRH
ncbi:hypothetical protein [Mycoplasma sp. E35C]|uniref:hypothetical protein n=1 Tax=Mycoplasma sp. E35C TaxID=2801918 RepID=UPI001CA3A481|nr:hypothetical protein [Mycoplasma sp. E35C]QZX49438.1 hypothetical protein JJE79_01680 [Mycoplasma sp. E35C]